MKEEEEMAGEATWQDEGTALKEGPRTVLELIWFFNPEQRAVSLTRQAIGVILLFLCALQM